VKTLGGRATKVPVEPSEMLPTLRAKVGRKLGDLEAAEAVRFFANGRELRPGLSMREQSVRPNSVLQLLRSRVHPWPHAGLTPPGDTHLRRPPGPSRKSQNSQSPMAMWCSWSTARSAPCC